MLFFQSKLNIADHEKVRLEFRLQQITDCIGAKRMRLQVLDVDQLVPADDSAKPESILASIRNHLSFDFVGFKIQEALEVVQQQSGGGG